MTLEVNDIIRDDEPRPQRGNDHAYAVGQPEGNFDLILRRGEYIVRSSRRLKGCTGDVVIESGTYQKVHGYIVTHNLEVDSPW